MSADKRDNRKDVAVSGTGTDGDEKPQHKGSSGKSDLFGKIAKQVASKSGSPATFVLAVCIILVWLITGPIFQFNDTWQLVINTGTTIITFLMVFLIQNTQNRDSAAVQLKLDEIVRALDAAGNEVMDLEEKSQEELDELRNQYEELAKSAQSAVQDKKAS